MDSKIYYNLLESPWKYSYNKYQFVFSSEFLLNKFVNKKDDFIYLQNARFNSNYKIDIDLYLYFLISFYKKVEKRGFLILKNDKKIVYPKFITEMVE